MSQKIAAVEAWWRKWNNRLMHAEYDMSRGTRTAMYNEVNEMVSIRNRTISALIDADPEASHYADMLADAKALIERDD